MQKMERTGPRLTPHLSQAGAWAFSIGTSVGWGSLVVTANTYLMQAGPLGSVLGMLVGTLVMLLISRNYAYLMNAFPEAGGAYAYARETYGYDQGFLVSWFLSLTYLAILWANATSLPLFAKYFLGDLFRFGKLYTIFGYDVYAGNILLSAAALLAAGVFCSRSKKAVSALMIGMAGLFTLGIAACFAVSLLRLDTGISPAWTPDSTELSQVVRIACISPWAFIGFESISHSVEEFSFSHRKIRRMMIVSVLMTSALYICVTLLSVTAYPPEYSSWFSYIRDLDSLSGLKGLPAFYAADHYLGGTGVTILMLSLLSLVLTSLFGNITALSRLFYALAKDRVLPERFARLNSRDIPSGAIGLIMGVSVLIPFLGRTAIGWIVDVTTLGATLVYAFVSASALKLARKREDRTEIRTGLIGLIIMLVFVAYLLLPNLFAAGSMASESLFLFVAWSVIGFIYFRYILKNDRQKRFGQSVIVWIALLSLVLFVSLVWMSQSIIEATDKGLNAVEDFYTEAGLAGAQNDLVARQVALVRGTSARSIVVVILIFALSLGILMNNYSLMSRRARESETQLGLIREKANTDPLTGVKSKHAFADKEAQLNEQIASGEAPPFALAVCDVNGLKLVNDTLGHKAGDEHIKKACHMICLIFAHSPIYRTGGDEFTVVLTGDDYNKRRELMEELHSRSVAHIAQGGPVVSGGLADWSPQDRLLHSVFERADQAMYTEKTALKLLGAPTR